MFPFLNHFDPAKDGAVRSRARQWVQEQKELQELSRAKETNLEDAVSYRSEEAWSNTSGKIHSPRTLKAAATTTTEPVRRSQSIGGLR